MEDQLEFYAEWMRDAQDIEQEWWQQINQDLAWCEAQEQKRRAA